MSGMLVDGTWRSKWTWEHDDSGDFKRQTSAFRGAIEDSSNAKHPVEPGRYRLYVSYACPWAHRTLLVRTLVGLDDVLPVTVVHPDMLDEGWELRDDAGDEVPEPEIGATRLHQLYSAANPSFTGRVTVPVLWDRVERTIVNNESREIIRQLDRTLGRLGKHTIDLHPAELLPRIDETLDAIYEPINNGVYRCGFAGSQEAYERAFRTLFAELDRWDAVLAKQRYLCGAHLTAADVAMFTTLVRFDPVYYVHFKCNGKLIQQYENLSGYVREIYQLPGVRETVRMDHIKRHYYYSHSWLNPRRFVAAGPDLAWLDAPHGREHLEGAPIFG